MEDGVETQPGEAAAGTETEGREERLQSQPGEARTEGETDGLEERLESEELETLEQAAKVEAPDQPDDADLAAAIVRLDSRLEESQRLLARQSDLIDRLHAENQELRAGELRSAQLPLVRDLLRMHDDVGRMRDAAGEADGDLRVLYESLVDTLARNGIERFAPEPGEPFDSRLHSATGVEPTEDETLDKAVAEVMRHGFRWESGDTIRVAEVRAYRYRDAG